MRESFKRIEKPSGAILISRGLGAPMLIVADGDPGKKKKKKKKKKETVGFSVCEAEGDMLVSAWESVSEVDLEGRARGCPGAV